MKVSVIVPSYNRASYLPMALESLRAQEAEADLEVIVVDDGSSDDTRSRVREFSSAHPSLSLRYIYQDHAGISAAKNRGVLAARGDWIAFLDSDDLWHPEKLKKQISFLEENRGCRIVFTCYENFLDLPEEASGPVQEVLLTERVDRCLATALAERSLFKEGGLFCPDLFVGEDTEWLLRNKILGLDLGCRLEEPLYLRRIHRSNISLEHRSSEKSRVGALIGRAFRNAQKIRRSKDENICTDTSL